MAKALEEFDEELFETRLEALKDTQEGIQQMSTWCLQHRPHYKKIIHCWLNVVKRVRVEHRLVLFHLANDVIQYSKRKRYEFVECWATALQRATTLVRDERVKGKVLRIFKIWEQRDIYNDEFLADLSGLLNISPPKSSHTTSETSDDFQNAKLITSIRDCVQLAELTDKSFSKLPKTPNCDIEVIKQQLKNKSNSCDVEKETERCVAFTNAYIKNLQNEIKSRKLVISNTEEAIAFYTNQHKEVKVVTNAYKNFGTRIKMVKKKLDEMADTLPSPIPSPDINAPSPERDAELQLPDEQSPISINIFKNTINGYSSYMDGNLPFDINDFKSESGLSTNLSSQPIEVIGARSDDENYSSGNEYYKPDPISSYTNNGNVAIPGLNSVSDVQTEYSSLARNVQQYNTLLPPPAPPAYGNNHSNEYVPHLPGYNNDQYTPNNGAPTSIMPPPPPLPPVINTQNANTNSDFNTTWDINMSWSQHDSSNASSTTSYGQATPHSPPHFEHKQLSGNEAPIEYTEHHTTDIIGAQDVDHRQIQLPPAFNFNTGLILSKDKTRQLVDIDHRNLISLTGSPHEKNFHTNASGDIDYRKQTKFDDNTGISNSMAPPNSSFVKKSPLKSNTSSSSESAKEDTASRYDPADMVIDMDMSDEDADEVSKEVSFEESNLTSNEQERQQSKEDSVSLPRSALLETPQEYTTQSNIWDTTVMPPSYMDGGNLNIDPHQQHQQHSHLPPWNQMPWNGNGGLPESPPRPPFALQFQQFQAVENMRGRGRGRGGWAQNLFRGNYPRVLRGAGSNMGFDNPRPYFGRVGGTGSIRGHRGKYRGNNAWI